MSDSPLIRVVRERLRQAGYRDFPTPLKISGVEFPFTGAMHGRDGRSLDLVLLIDTTTGDFGDRDGIRVRQRVEALSRALDITGSRYVVTVILAGVVLTEGIGALSETCRVLQVENVVLDEHGKPVDDSAAQALDDSIRILLPLAIPISLTENAEGTSPAMEQLSRALPVGMEETLAAAVIAASAVGEQAVTEAVALTINDAIRFELGDE